MDTAKYANYLSISQRGKGIPYGGTGVLRDDGDTNYGFKYLKGNEPGLRQVPELVKDAALLRLALAINHSETGLFSVGCVSGQSQDHNGFRGCGYMEFAINSHSAIADAMNYFPLFFHFDRFLHESKFSIPTRFEWELQGATFTECGPSSGFTCSVFVNTPYSHSKEEADHAWSQSLEGLGYYLKSVPPERNDFLYPQ
jgi:hypothetical protein